MNPTLRWASRGRLCAFVAMAAAVLLLVATGTGFGASKPLTKKLFVKKANAACTAYIAAVTQLKKPRTWAGFRTVTIQNHNLRVRLVHRLEKLHPPARHRAQFKTLLGRLRANLVIDAKVLQGIKTKSAARLRTAFVRKAKIGTATAATARKLGLTACAPRQLPSK